mgnify:CR=1 FL=1
MSAISRDDAAHLALLAPTDLSADEPPKLSGDPAHLLRSLATGSAVAHGATTPTSPAHPPHNAPPPHVLRP